MNNSSAVLDKQEQKGKWDNALEKQQDVDAITNMKTNIYSLQ